MTDQRKTTEWIKDHKIATVGIGFLLFVVLITILAPKTPETQPVQKEQPKVQATQPQPKATYETDVLSSAALNSKTRFVTVKVKNTGKSDGSPRCFVRATSSIGNYKGYDAFTGDEVPLLKTVKAGEEVTFAAQLTITDNGAELIDQATAECN